MSLEEDSPEIRDFLGELERQGVDDALVLGLDSEQMIAKVNHCPSRPKCTNKAVQKCNDEELRCIYQLSSYIDFYVYSAMSVVFFGYGRSPEGDRNSSFHRTGNDDSSCVTGTRTTDVTEHLQCMITWQRVFLIFEIYVLLEEEERKEVLDPAHVRCMFLYV